MAQFSQIKKATTFAGEDGAAARSADFVPLMGSGRKYQVGIAFWKEGRAECGGRI